MEDWVRHVLDEMQEAQVRAREISNSRKNIPKKYDRLGSAEEVSSLSLEMLKIDHTSPDQLGLAWLYSNH